MLEMRPSCECCDKDLPPSTTEAMICSFECTFCRECVDDRLAGICPNCGGGFSQRPPRAEILLEKYPAAIERTLMPDNCGGH